MVLKEKEPRWFYCNASGDDNIILIVHEKACTLCGAPLSKEEVINGRHEPQLIGLETNDLRR